jgi:hypothetical protein
LHFRFATFTFDLFSSQAKPSACAICRGREEWKFGGACDENSK